MARYPAMAESITTFVKQNEGEAGTRLDILDIGVGRGRTLRFLEGADLLDRLTLHGLDLEIRADLYKPEAWSLTVGNAEEKLPYDDASMDIVVFEQVLEHLWDIETPIREIERVLRDDGILVIGVPTFPRPLAAVRDFYVRKFPERHLRSKSGHHQTFSRGTIVRHLRKTSSLQIESVRGFRILSGGKIEFLEDYGWWYRFSLFLARLFPCLCTEVQIVARRPGDRLSQIDLSEGVQPGALIAGPRTRSQGPLRPVAAIPGELRRFPFQVEQGALHNASEPDGPRAAASNPDGSLALHGDGAPDPRVAQGLPWPWPKELSMRSQRFVVCVALWLGAFGMANAIERGDVGPRVVELQQALNRHRILTGQRAIAEDGDYGPLTQGAISEYQRAAGLPPDGEAGDTTQAALALCGVGQSRVLARGSLGDAVRSLQQALNRERGRSGVGAIAVDGDFGPRTEAALIAFQQAALGAAAATGRTNPATHAALSNSTARVGSGPRALSPHRDDHGDSAQAATPLPLGPMLAGAIDSAGDADWFSVRLVFGRPYTFTTHGLREGMNSRLQLYFQGARVASNDDVHVVTAGVVSSRIDYLPRRPGTYHLVVTHSDPAAARGAYQVRARLSTDDHGEFRAGATPLCSGFRWWAALRLGETRTGSRCAFRRVTPTNSKPRTSLRAWTRCCSSSTGTGAR